MKIKKIIKRIVPNKIIQEFRLGFSNIYYYKRIKYIEKNKDVNTIYVFGSAIHRNLGDHLITIAEKKFIKDNKNNCEIIEIPTEMYQIYREKLKKNISKSNTIIINGGGWMGNLWVKEELLIEDMVKLFKYNRIILFPQTIYYDKNIKPYNDLINTAREAFYSNKKFTITVRENESFEFAKKNFGETKALLVPDIALYYYNSLNNMRNIKKKNIVKFCLRKDRENIQDKQSIMKIKKILKNNNIKIDKITTMAIKRISEKKRNNTLNKKFKRFAESNMVITDRLHGMIFSYLVGTPCIVLDNKTRKVSGVYEKWLSESKIIFPLYKNKNEKDLEKFILDVIDNKKISNEVNIDFSKLREEINNG